MFLNTAVWIKVMLAILIAFVVSFALTPVVKILAQKLGAMDVPGEARRVHDHPIPRMGGLAIFLGFIVSMLLFVDITQEVRGILLGSIIIVITGVIDDIISLRAWTKFLIQILAAVIGTVDYLYGVSLAALVECHGFFGSVYLFKLFPRLFIGGVIIGVRADNVAVVIAHVPAASNIA